MKGTELTLLTPDQIRDKLIAAANDLGIDCIGFASVENPGDDRQRLFEWLTKGYHASMSWIERDAQRRSDPRQVLPGARSLISIAVNYNTGESPCDDCGALKVSRYAWGEDYHRVLGRKLKHLKQLLDEWTPGERSIAYVDTGPVMEKAWAQRAGLGWIGKNANLVTRDYGSWVFLGEIITTQSLPPDSPHTDFCGSCTHCIDACPTDAFPEPYVLDAGKCISYWTIEHRGDFPEGVGDSFGGWIFGCDVCQDVCPWNKFGKATREPAFSSRPEAVCPPEGRWVRLSEDEFKKEFRNSAIRRARRDGLMRNIHSQRNDPLDTVLKALRWEPVDDPVDIRLDEIGRETR